MPRLVTNILYYTNFGAGQRHLVEVSCPASWLIIEDIIRLSNDRMIDDLKCRDWLRTNYTNFGAGQRHLV